MTSHGALIVFGSGPGVGLGVAKLFAERGYTKVVLISRNADRLAEDAKAVRAVNNKTNVHEVPIDLGNTTELQRGLGDIDKRLGDTPLECILFNAARTGPSRFFDFSAEDLEADLRIAIIALYTIAQWPIPKLLLNTANNPSFIVTSGMLAKDPYPAMFSLATCKAGQYSLVHSLHKEFEPQGVHVGIVIIAGTVSENSQVTNPRNIAEEIWKMSTGGTEQFEVVVQDPEYDQHVKNRER